ncbi:Trans-1,2-dihydrobenzene-1,2-diol dehydrogenase [Orchesella cincta]|uniref:Trans-1,2-dihydrobenzene-1,2-diol dehydrogenase n=1 Tax=Orchesella cincta TaxID=48709 RepID=A0A1D2MQY9_ORCCI|nr:Trans-1,2-dihydrobenzene-1,2-diol dehydrogenase [Orchesella cincta]
MSDLTTRPLRWGIISAGLISHDFVVALGTLNPQEHIAVAVGARRLEDAEKFAKLHGIPKAYDSYQKVFEDPEVDVVYIGAIHPTHLPLGKAALDAGKPVLCEKPLCINVRETKELLEHAKAKNLFFMEALWVRFFPAYQKLKELLSTKAIGDVANVFISFGVPLGDVDRCKLLNLGGGTTLDIGLYCTQLSILVYGQEFPEKILSTGVLNESGADVVGSTTLKFPSGGLATFITSYKSTMPNEAFYHWNQRKHQDAFSILERNKLELLTDGAPPQVFEYPVPVGAKPINFWNTTGLSYQCHEVRKCLIQGKVQSDVMPHSETLRLSQILEEIRKQIGVKYPQDDE